MKLDKDLVRLILLKAEDEMPDNTAVDWNSPDFPDHDMSIVGEHVRLMMEAGLLRYEQPMMGVETVLLSGISWEGYQFLESVRDDELWRETKALADEVKASTLDLLAQLAVGLVKTKIAKHTGVEL